ncbi:MAG TPA: glycogen synthase, partial [Homoserinimonas sp.]|nr:glycogen synthase [Homoserinimonas sp.]
MRVDILTREYPPEVYGGAGVHVTELVRAMRSDLDVRVRCFGGDREGDRVDAYRVPSQLADA